MERILQKKANRARTNPTTGKVEWDSVPVESYEDLVNHKDAHSITVFGNDARELAVARDQASAIAESLHFTGGVEPAVQVSFRNSRRHETVIGYRAVRAFAISPMSDDELNADTAALKKALA